MNKGVILGEYLILMIKEKRKRLKLKFKEILNQNECLMKIKFINLQVTTI